MGTLEKKHSAQLMPLTYAWLLLVVLTLMSLYFGQWFHGAGWLQPLVAAIIFLKGILVAKRFIEIDVTHPFIRRVVYGFVAVTPVLLIAITYFGEQLVRWVTL